jgi:hypothetical protein
MKSLCTRLSLAALLLAGCGCRPGTSGTVGKHKIGVGNLIVVEGEGFSWDNRVPATQPTARPVE